MTSEFENFENTNSVQDEFISEKHSLKRKQAERKLRKKRKRLNRLKRFLRFLVIVGILFGGYELYKLPGWYLTADTFKNPASGKVEILNNKISPTSTIENVLKDIKVSEQPIFFVRVKSIKNKLLEIPVIKNVYVRRYAFPARFQIIVQERVPLAVIKSDLNLPINAFFTTDGKLVLDKQYLNFPKEYPVMVILSSSNNIKKDWSIAKIRDVEKIIKSVELYSGEQVEYIDMRNPNDVYVKIPKTNIRLGTLDSSVFERIKRIYTILPQITEVDSRVKYLDLSWDKVNYLKLNKTEAKKTK